MMHIVIDARMIDASGIGVYLHNILIGILDEYRITLLGDPAKLNKYASKATIIPLLIPIYSVKEQIVLRTIIPECDLFWSPHYNIPIFKIRANKRVVTIHDVYHLAFKKQLSFLQRLYASVVIRTAVKLSNEIITVSNFSKSELIKYLGNDAAKATVIHNGVSFSGEANRTEAVNMRYNIPNRYILYVGNVKPHKNLKKLLEAYLLLKTELSSLYKIVIVGKKDGFITGDTALFSWIENIPTLKDRIIFTGFVADEDISFIYENASVLVFPSLYEGFGLPPLEAMLNFCPAIVSNKSSMPEICSDAVLYFDPFDTKDLSEKITSVLTNNDLRNQLINKGKLRVSAFKWDTAILQHIAVFNNTISVSY